VTLYYMVANLPIYHFSHGAKWIKTSNGRVHKFVKGFEEVRTHSFWVSNDADGRAYIKEWKKGFVFDIDERPFYLYRCPEDGKPYPHHGSVGVKRGSVIYVGLRKK